MKSRSKAVHRHTTCSASRPERAERQNRRSHHHRFSTGYPEKRIARFRAYDSYADAFKDYARMINESPR